MKIIENRAIPFAKDTAIKLALVLGIAVLLWATGAPMFLNYAHAKAANLSSVSDILTNSNNSTYSGHTIQYTNSTSTLAGQTINIQLDPDTHAFTEIGDAATSTHFSLSFFFGGATTTIPILGACAGTSTTLAETGNTGNLTFTICTGTNIPGNAVITFAMATSAQLFINPPGTGSYRVTIGGTQLNSGETRVAILPNVTLTAAIATIFTFTVTGDATSTVINHATTTATATATALPFGTLVSGTTTTLGQHLVVTTNARNGFVVTVQANQPPTSGSGAIINSFEDGATTTAPQPWALPQGILNQYNTYSHFGLTSNAASSSPVISSIWANATSTKYMGAFITSPLDVFDWNGPSDGTTQNVGMADVAYSISISPLQAAGNDYTNTLTYVATPTF